MKESIESYKNDTLLIIRQVCLKFFNTNFEPLSSKSSSSKTCIMGGTTSLDFNITTEGAKMYTNKIAIASDSCPAYYFLQLK